MTSLVRRPLVRGIGVTDLLWTAIANGILLAVVFAPVFSVQLVLKPMTALSSALVGRPIEYITGGVVLLSPTMEYAVLVALVVLIIGLWDVLVYLKWRAQQPRTLVIRGEGES